MKKIIHIALLAIIIVSATTISYGDYLLNVRASTLLVRPGATIIFKGTVTANGIPVRGVQVGIDDPIKLQCIPGPKTDADGCFVYSCPTGLSTKPGLYTFCFYNDGIGIHRTYITLTVDNYFANRQTWAGINVTLGTTTELDDNTLSLSTKGPGGLVQSTPSTALLQTGLQIAEFTGDWLGNTGKDFISNPINDIAIVGLVSCAVPEPTVSKAVCAAVASYVEVELEKTAAIALLETMVDRSNMTEAEKEDAKSLIRSEDCLIGAATLNPNSAIAELGSTDWTCLEAVYTLTRNSQGKISSIAISGSPTNEGGVTHAISVVRHPDHIPPTVLGYQYTALKNPIIQLSFSEDLDVSTLTSSAITLKGSETGNHSCTLSFDHSSYRLAIRASTDFNYEELVTVIASTSIRDLAGNGMSSAFTFSFTVKNPVAVPTALLLDATVIPNSGVDPFSPVTISGSVHYNADQDHDGQNDPVPTGTITINTADNIFTAAISDGTFNEKIQSPSSSRNISISVRENKYGLSTTQSKWIDISAKGSSPYYTLATYVIYDYTYDGRNVSWSNKPAFRTTDNYVNAFAYFTNVSTSRGLGVMWRFYNPNGTQYGSDLRVDDAVPAGSWAWYFRTWGFLIKDNLMSYIPGEYRIDTYIDQKDGAGYTLKATDYYAVGWNFTEHRLAKDVDGQPDYMPISETNTFNQNDTKVLTWANFDLVAQGTDLRCRFYEPDGSLYAEVTPPGASNYKLGDPGGQSSYWSWYRAWAWIYIKGYAAANLCGKWRAEVSAKNATTGNWDLVYTDYFQILESPSQPPLAEVELAPDVKPGIGPLRALSSNVVGLIGSTHTSTASQDVTVTVTATDNSSVKKLTLWWNDATNHNKILLENNFTNSYVGSSDLGSFPNTTRLEFYASAQDESDNQAFSNHIGLIIGASDTLGPDISGVTVDEYEGNGDGILQEDERAKISLHATDPTGVQSVTITVNGISQTVTSQTYSVCGPFSAGEHFLTISATDNDVSPHTSVIERNFSVSPKPAVSVLATDLLPTFKPGTVGPVASLRFLSTKSVPIIKGLVITRTGTATDVDVPYMEIVEDINQNGLVDISDSCIADSVFFSNGLALLNGIEYPVSDAADLLVVFGVDKNANTSHTAGATIQSNSLIWKTSTDVVFNGVKTVECPLPVQLTSFVGLSVGKEVRLSWSTSAEINMSCFDVQRLSPGQPAGVWSSLGNVAAHGTSNLPHDYEYVDSKVPFGHELYRLIQVDADGSRYTSNSITVNVESEKSGLTLDSYPNPFNPSTTIEFSVPEEGHLSVKLYNQLGGEVRTLFDGTAQGEKLYQVPLNGEGLASGVYIVRLLMERNGIARKILLLK